MMLGSGPRERRAASGRQKLGNVISLGEASQPMHVVIGMPNRGICRNVAGFYQLLIAKAGVIDGRLSLRIGKRSGSEDNDISTPGESSLRMLTVGTYKRLLLDVLEGHLGPSTVGESLCSGRILHRNQG